MLSEIYRCISQYFQANADILTQLRHGPFLPDPFQYCIHQSSNHSTLIDQLRTAPCSNPQERYTEAGRLLAGSWKYGKGRDFHERSKLKRDKHLCCFERNETATRYVSGRYMKAGVRG